MKSILGTFKDITLDHCPWMNQTALGNFGCRVQVSLISSCLSESTGQAAPVFLPQPRALTKVNRAEHPSCPSQITTKHLISIPTRSLSFFALVHGIITLLLLWRVDGGRERREARKAWRIEGERDGRKGRKWLARKKKGKACSKKKLEEASKLITRDCHQTLVQSGIY